MDNKFPEPRGWALRWEGTALFSAADCVPRDAGAQEAAAGAQEAAAGAQEAAAPPTGWALQWKQVTGAGTPPSRNSYGRNGHSRARACALQWDGSALTASAGGDEPASHWAIDRESEGAA